jgi:hypothetical protein
MWWWDLFREYLRASVLNSANAQMHLGVFYATGDFGDWERPDLKNERKAVRWYTAAAQQGLPEAQYNLGFMILLGEGTLPNAERSLHWLEMAGHGGSEEAAKLLGDLYDGWGQGRGVQRDGDRAAYWRARAPR